MPSLVPTDRDVLLGRGYSITQHPGNISLRALVDARKSDFAATKRKAVKRRMAEAIVGEIENGGGRFLAEAPPGTRAPGAAGASAAGAAGAGEENGGEGDASGENNRGGNRNSAGDAATNATVAERLRRSYWIAVDRERAVEKVLHRLRERNKPPKTVKGGGSAGEESGRATGDAVSNNATAGGGAAAGMGGTTGGWPPLSAGAPMQLGRAGGSLGTAHMALPHPALLQHFALLQSAGAASPGMLPGMTPSMAGAAGVGRGGPSDLLAALARQQQGGMAGGGGSHLLTALLLQQQQQQQQMLQQQQQQQQVHRALLAGALTNLPPAGAPSHSALAASSGAAAVGSGAATGNGAHGAGAWWDAMPPQQAGAAAAGSAMARGDSLASPQQQQRPMGSAAAVGGATLAAAASLPSAMVGSPGSPPLGARATSAAAGLPWQDRASASSPNRLAAAGPTAAGNVVTLAQWTDAAGAASCSKEGRLRGAVDLAVAMARHVRALAEGGAAVDAAAIAAEHVRITLGGAPSTNDRSSIRGVHFAASRAAPVARGPLPPRAACAALGQIFLRLFAPERSRATDDAPSLKDRTRPDAAAPHPKKRKSPALSSHDARRGGEAAAPADNHAPPSLRAHALLAKRELPLSVCQLVCDLLDAAAPPPLPSNALASLDEALLDLEQMQARPASFLFDRTPERAVEDAHLAGGKEAPLFGRGKEMAALREAKRRTNDYVGTLGNSAPFASADQTDQSNFLCEAVFLRGYAGSGKSSLLRSFVDSCAGDDWFVVQFKFEKQIPPFAILFQAFNDFFGKWAPIVNGETSGASPESSGASPALIASFREACEGISNSVDNDGLAQLCDLIPNAALIFPARAATTDEAAPGAMPSSMEKVGSAEARLKNLVNVLVKSLCSTGRPVCFVLDDLQWSDSLILEGMSNFVVNYMHSSINKASSRGAHFIAGAFRSNEVEEGAELLRAFDLMKESKKATVTTIDVGQLTKEDVTRLLSSKLCLPWRYTRELAGLVHTKTRGNPFFVIQFLRAITQNGMLEYSVLSRRWMWDLEVVDLQMISDDVAGLLIASFNQLPPELMQSMKIASCLGCQMYRGTIQALDATRKVLSCCMLDQLELAVKEGIMERAGPVYQFTHDILHQTIYGLIPDNNRGALHKKIGLSLLAAASSDPAIHMLAVDQINVFCRESAPSTAEERALIATSNAQAAKLALAESNFGRARAYIDVGIKLLDSDHWTMQYKLSLDLFEMSASVHSMHGDNAQMSESLTQLLANARTFEDSLTGAGMLAQLLASNSNYDDARQNCLDILEKLGEELPSEADLATVQKSLIAAKVALQSITHAQIKALHPMTDTTKRNAMKFLNMLCSYCVISKPLLLPVLSCRMVTLTLEYGFCDDSIVGIATAGYSLFLFTDDIPLAFHLGEVSERLVEECPRKNVLRSRLSLELVSTLKMIREPWHQVCALYPGYYQSAMAAGDVDNALVCLFSFCCCSFWSAASDLPSVSQHLVSCIKEATKYQMKAVKYGAMAVSNSTTYLMGKGSTEIEALSLDQLEAIEGKTNLLVWQIFMCRLTNSFWMGDYDAMMELSEQHSRDHPAAQEKRILHVLRCFYEGVASLSLARKNPAQQQSKWRALGEKAVATIAQFEWTMSKDNFANKSQLLRAELYYLNGDLDLAETAYRASIVSAGEQKFVHEQALAHELYGRCCVENGMVEKGLAQLQAALDNYGKWGARRKVEALQSYVDGIASSTQYSA